MDTCELTKDLIFYRDFIKETLFYIEKGTLLKPWRQGFFHWRLSSEYYDLGMSYIPTGSISYAKGAFQNAVNIRYWYFKKYLSIHDWTFEEIKNLGDQYEEQVILSPHGLSAAAWMELLLAVLLDFPEIKDFSRKYAKIAHRNNNYPIYEHAPESQYIGLLISSIINEDIDYAMKLLHRKRPSIEPMFRGIPECLENIVRQNKEDFLKAMKNAEKQWKRVAHGSQKGMPYSTCFIWGCCLFKLSERVFGKNIYHDFLEQNKKCRFPPQLLDPNIAPQDPYPIPSFVLDSP
jgi:hypothetical protein